MISFQQSWEKAQTISGDFTDTTLIQLKQDINIGYQRFNAAIARYFTRKQQFTDLVAGQQYYQIPVDAIRVSIVTNTLPNGYIYPVEECRSEKEWREMNIVHYTSNYASFYFILGSDQIGLWPIPAQDVSQGLRFVYQPQDVFLTKDNYITGTVSINNGSVTVTGVGTSWNAANAKGMYFQTTDNTDGNWYEVLSVDSTTQLTLKTPYVGSSVSGTTYQLGQTFIFPGEYDDVPVDYALSRFYESRNSPERAQYHLNKYQQAVDDAVGRYASSSTSNVITDSDDRLNAWFLPPMPGVGS